MPGSSVTLPSRTSCIDRDGRLAHGLAPRCGRRARGTARRRRARRGRRAPRRRRRSGRCSGRTVAYASAHAGPAWIVLPTYREADNLAPMVGRAARRRCRPTRAILVVDDASPDGTGALADRLAAADPRVEVLHRPGKAGLGPAYVAGFAHALAHGAGAVRRDGLRLLPRPRRAAARCSTRVADGADVVLGSRYVPGGAGGELVGVAAGGRRAAAACTRAPCCACPCATSPAASSAFRADALRRDRLRDARARGATRSRSS